jgi:hypothetical protein
MRTDRRLRTARMLLALVALLGSLWVGGVTSSTVGDPAGQLTAGRAPAAVEAAVLRDRLPALRPPLDRPGPWGTALLVGVAATALAGAFRWRAGEVRHRLAGVRSLATPASLGARSPPRLQPA